MTPALEKVKISRPQNNYFDLTHDRKLSMNMGELVPVLCHPCVPGDRLKLNGECIARFAPIIAPMMHRVDLYVHYFFVPWRLLWENSETYLSNGSVQGGFPGTLPAFPYIEYGAPTSGGIGYTKLMDYLDLPPYDHSPNVDPVLERVSAMPFAAYQRIYADYYRDENLVPYEFTPLQDGDNTGDAELFVLRKRAWEADYFTKALPFAQKGDPVSIPLGNFQDVPVLADRSSTPALSEFEDILNARNAFVTNFPSTNPDIVDETLYAQTSTLNVDAATINDLRLAFRLQEWLEKNARGGTRYAELIMSHFGVRPQDARLQRPEYITGLKSPVQISEVLNTTGGDLPQGNMAGHGVTYASGKFGKYFVQEHGYLMGIMSIMPKTAYMQGIPKHFLQINDPTELYWPSFAHLGEQEILNREIYAFTNEGGDTFGYTPRYMEYKQIPSSVNGDFRTSLEYWHMARKFENMPALNEQFVTADPTERIFAVTDPTAQKMYVHMQNNLKAVRPMPIFGTPTF